MGPGAPVLSYTQTNVNNTPTLCTTPPPGGRGALLIFWVVKVGDVGHFMGDLKSPGVDCCQEEAVLLQVCVVLVVRLGVLHGRLAVG